MSHIAVYSLYSGLQCVIGHLLRDQAAEDCVSGEMFTDSCRSARRRSCCAFR